MNTDKTIQDEDVQLINNVVEIEKDLVLLQLRSITFSDFKHRTSSFIDSYYEEAYFEGKEKLYNDIGSLVVSTKTPVYQYISKVCSSDDGAFKYIFIKIPQEDTTSQWAKMYIFKKENSEWKIFSVNNYYLVIDRQEPKRIIERFTNYNDNPIEYEHIKILD